MKTHVLITLGFWGALALATSAQTIPNPSFEANSFTVWPGYISSNSPIVGWFASDPLRAGLNPASGSPFADNGTVPDGNNVAFIQSTNAYTQSTAIASLSTVISNLTIGQTYKVNFRANARSGNTPNLKVYFAGTNVINTTVTAVGGFNPYYYFDFYFMATDVTNTLTVLNDASGDNTLLVDNFSIAPSPLISNPSFEFNSFTNSPGYISGNTNIVGWTTTDPAHAGLNPAGGNNPFADNGTVPDGNNVAFIQSLGGNSSLSTVFSNLTVGQTYKVNFRVNARNSTNYIPNLNVSIDTSNIVNSTVTPVYSKNPYKYFAFDFTAGATNRTMTLRNDATTGDNTVLVDAFDIAVRNSGWSYAAWSNDASAGITGNPTNYTHAYNFGSDSNVIINGVTFTNTGSANGNPANSLFFTTGLPDVYTNDNNNLTTETNQGSAVLAHDFLWGGPSGASESITIGGLLKGNSYVATIYSVGYHGDTGIYTSRTVTFNVGNDYLTVNQDQFGYGNGIRVSYAYTATSNTITLTYVPLEGGQTFYTYGFCNALVTNGHAAFPIVTNLADSGPGSLRQVINHVAPGDTITFDPSLSGETSILTNGELLIPYNLTIDASALTNGFRISGNGSSRILELTAGATVTLDSLALFDGYPGASASGGAIIVNTGTTLTLNNSTVSNNTCYQGGGIINGGTLTLNNSTVTSNSAAGNYGGGIYNIGSISLNNSKVSGNSSSGDGGGIWSQGTLSLTNSTLSGNSSTTFGGGIACTLGSRLTINNCTLSGNSANTNVAGGGDGGGIYNLGTMAVNNSTLSSNSASSTIQGGGGIFNQGTSTLTNCTLSGNSAPNGYGGGIDSGYSTLTMTNCTLSGNSAGIGGGGIRGEADGTVTINNSTLTNNFISSGSGGGGGIYNDLGGMFTVNNCILSGNSAINGNSGINGGGILNLGTMAVNNSTLSHNTSGGAGGAIAMLYGILTVNNSTLSDNSAETDDGGGIYDLGYSYGATNTLNNCILSGNSASGYGGGIANDVNSILIVNNSTLSGNTASFGGGIASDNTLTVNNSTLSGNSATSVAVGGGGGIWNQGVSTLNNCTLSGNSAPNGYGGGMNNDAGPLFCTNTIVAGNNALSYADIYNGTNASFSGANNLTNGNPLLAPLGNYGGPTQTMPPLAGSPAIDAGSDSVTNFLATDQRGYPRLSGAHVDVGAVEVQFVAANPGNPPVLKHPVWSSSGGSNTVRFTFTNVSGADFTALASTNLTLSLSNWTVLGNIPEISPGQFQFTDPGATNYPQRFYRVVSP
jgi:hypothetical protein